MAVAGMTAAENYAVGTPLKRFQDKHGIDAAGARHADDFHIGGIVQSVRSRKVGTRIGAPVAAERDDFRFEFTYRHIASTSAMICLLENPERSIAPDGQATVQAPQP